MNPRPAFVSALAVAILALIAVKADACNHPRPVRFEPAKLYSLFDRCKRLANQPRVVQLACESDYYAYLATMPVNYKEPRK